MSPFQIMVHCDRNCLNTGRPKCGCDAVSVVRRVVLTSLAPEDLHAEEGHKGRH